MRPNLNADTKRSATEHDAGFPGTVEVSASGMRQFRGTLRAFASAILCATVTASVAMGADAPRRDVVLAAEARQSTSRVLADALAARAVKIDCIDGNFPFLADLVKGKRVVGIGEESHGTSEFIGIEWNLVRQLSELGFRDIALEVSADQVVALDAFLNGDPTVSAEAAARPFAIRGTSETAAAFKWLREHNAKATPENRIRIWPVDTLDMSVQVATLRSAFSKHDGEAKRAMDTLTRFSAKSFYDPKPGQAITEAEARRAQSAINTLAAVVAEAKSGDPVNAARVRLALVVVERYTEFVIASLSSRIDMNDPNLAMVNANIMDRAMAEAISLIAQDGRRVVYMAHNAHIQKGGMLSNGGPIRIETSAGIMISAKLGNDYLTLGLKTGTGTTNAAKWDLSGGLVPVSLGAPAPGSFEEVLAAASGGASIFVDMRDMPAADFVFSERFVATCYEPGDPRGMGLTVPGKAYDAIIFVPKTKASKLLPRER